MSPEDLLELDQTFVTILFNGTVIELKPNGKNIKLTEENKAEYLCLLKQVTLSEFIPAFQKIKEGFYTVLRQGDLVNITPSSLELAVIGNANIDLEILKKNSTYMEYDSHNNLDENHPAIARLWRVLGSFNQKQLALYYKYVCGRTRLSVGNYDPHKVEVIGSNNRNIPSTKTCYFTIQVGNGYESDEELKTKLLYGMEHCNEIAESDRDYNLNEDFGQ